MSAKQTREFNTSARTGCVREGGGTLQVPGRTDALPEGGTQRSPAARKYGCLVEKKFA